LATKPVRRDSNFKFYRMLSIGYVLLVVYFFCIILITIYCLMQFDLLKYYRKKDVTPPPALPNPAPLVTIQLPMFNELYVAERLIDNIVKFDYPKDKLHIQVIDDSDDQTVEIVANKVAEYRAKGFDIEHVRRPNRHGFKAGALKDATPTAKGEFLAIFDADFVPRTDFLQKTIPHFFKNEKIGVVQTRWEHINEQYSVITALQALQLNVHFTIEQAGRARGGFLLQFNGTAGVWRKATIEDAGGWQSDTLTEDLDLSYRAQMKGWKIEYLEEVGSPAELPADMNGLKGQQFRWMKGGAENARKLLNMVWSNPLSKKQRWHATQHLLASGTFLLLFTAAVVSVPLSTFIPKLYINTHLFNISLLGMFSLFSLTFEANLEKTVRFLPYWKAFWRVLGLILVFIPMAMGMSLHNSIAVIEGYSGRKSDFVRTPKFGLEGTTGTFSRRIYQVRRPSLSTILEALLAVYFGYGAYMGIQSGVHEFVLFHLLLMVGFGSVSFFSIKHLWR
jgi:cellulose synthase/poly-beta-1,6-N-acetylglucosamine synthase-like glycosyltransferase